MARRINRGQLQPSSLKYAVVESIIQQVNREHLRLISQEHYRLCERLIDEYPGDNASGVISAITAAAGGGAAAMAFPCVLTCDFDNTVNKYFKAENNILLFMDCY